jgi:hypothetical protein
MDDLIERLEELSGPRYPDDICGKQLMAQAANALRAYAEREAEYREALAYIRAILAKYKAPT